MHSKNKLARFKFSKFATIGSADAVNDKGFLAQSFINSGALDILLETTDPRCIIVGRTGVGKTALLEMISEFEERTIKLSSSSLALIYLSNSEVIKFFIDLGVNMDLFYKLLWRHVFVVEIIRRQFKIIDKESQLNFFQRFF